MSISEAADKEDKVLHKAVHHVLHIFGLAVDGLSSACDMLLSLHTTLAIHVLSQQPQLRQRITSIALASLASLRDFDMSSSAGAPAQCGS